MKPLIRYILSLSVLLSGAASPQRPSPGAVSPPAAPADSTANPPPPTPPGGSRPFQRDRQIVPQAPPAKPPATGAPSSGAGSKPVVKESTRVQMPTCEEVRRNAKFGILFDKVEIEKLVQTVADATCKTFILPENIRGKISIIGPENGRMEVDADQFYAAFLAALDSNGLTVYSYGKFLKIIEKQKAKTTNIPLITNDREPYTTNEQMVTRLFKVKYVELDQLRAVLQSMVSQGGDTQIFQPDTLIVNDTASNMHRLQRIVEQLDVRPSSDEIRVIQLKYS